MKPSKTISILTAVAAILGGGTYALLSSQQKQVETVSQTEVSATPTPETSTSSESTSTSTSPTAAPAVSTDLAAETTIFEKEFSSLSEDDFLDSSLDDASLGL
jgi:hypothetical protein